MAVDVSTIKDVVASGPLADVVKAVAKAAPTKAEKRENKLDIPPEEPDKVKSKKPATVEEVVKAASEIKVHLKSLDTDLRFEVDIDNNEVIVKVLDPETDEVIRQIPSEEVLAIRKMINRLVKQVGVLHDIKT